MCAGLRQHADVELALMQAIPAMARNASCLPYVNRVLDQLCPPGASCFVGYTNSPNVLYLRGNMPRGILRAAQSAGFSDVKEAIGTTQTHQDTVVSHRAVL